MSQIKKTGSNQLSPMAVTRHLTEIKDKTGNLYESIAIIAKRANQINLDIREELHSKLEDFVSHTDNLEEIHENKEQIEISRFYERQPNPSLLATAEFMDDKVFYRSRENEDQQYS